MKVREHIQHIDTDDVHGRMKSFMHWKHVHLEVWGRLKFELRMLVMDQNFGEDFSYNLGLSLMFGIKENMHTCSG